jgi:hypothetical protein
MGIIRPFGPFTFTGQNVVFTAWIVSCFVAFILLSRRGRLDNCLLAISAVTVGSMAVLTGSRAIYFTLAAILGVTFIGLVVSGRMRANIGRILWIAAGVSLAAWLFTAYYGDMLMAMQARMEAASFVEGSIMDRAFEQAFGFIEPVETAPILGYGIGMGTVALMHFLNAQPFMYGEGELGRNINELGVVLGLVFIAMRFVLSTQLLLVASRVAKRGGLAVLPFAGFASLSIAVDQITASSVNAFLPWFVAGIILATARAGRGGQPSQAHQFSVPHGLRVA